MIIITIQIETDYIGATGITLRSMASKDKTSEERIVAEEIWKEVLEKKQEKIIKAAHADEECLSRKTMKLLGSDKVIEIL